MIATIAEMYSGKFVRFIVSSAAKNQLAILQLSICIQDSLTIGITLLRSLIVVEYPIDLKVVPHRSLCC